MRLSLIAVALVAIVLATPPATSHAEPKLSFSNDVLPVLTKFGCNGGGCHGKATGQNGFKLSLFGYDPAFDYGAIVHEAFGRRVSIAAPDSSLLLLKPTLQVPHGGGQRFDVDSDAYRLLKTWIAQGSPHGPPNDPTLSTLVLTPSSAVFPTAGQSMPDVKTQLRVEACYSDGSRRDVTGMAEYSTTQAALLKVSRAGLVESLGKPGEATVMVRYLELVSSARFVMPYAQRGDDPAYKEFHPKNYIDEHALRKWRSLGLLPSGNSTDGEFLRRAYLDALGVLPTPQEVRDFLANDASDKRDALVDRLFDRPEYVDLWATKWGDILRNNQRTADVHDRSLKFDAWIRKSLADNVPFDQFVRSLIAVRGTIEDHPQIDWYRQLMNVQMRVEDTCQLFLGIRVSCANCHNHPFQRISQDDYWQFAAFFARFEGESYRIKKIGVNPQGKMLHPRTGKPLAARAFGTPEFEFTKDEDPREKLVDWMVAAENPYFSRAIANRIWAHFMVRGLVEQIDDLRPTNPATNPELLDALAHDVAAHGYDLKHLMKTIMKSRVYGLSSLPRPENAADTENYARRHPERLSAQALFDAVTSVTGVAEPFKDYPSLQRASQLPNDAAQSDFLDIFGRSMRDSACECEANREPNFPQVLYLMYSAELQSRLANKEGNAARLAAIERSPSEIAEELFLLAFARRPSEAESQAAVKLIEAASSRQSVVEDLMWTLLNSKEFLFNH